jgi:hypothetical protein
MRLPLVIPFDARADQLEQDGRMTNMVGESYDELMFLTQRPGLTLSKQVEGAGNGIICYDDGIVAMWGDVLDYITVSATVYSAGTTYALYDVVFYDGEWWVSLQFGNAGNTPAVGSAYWSAGAGQTTWDDAATYEIGDEVEMFGTKYYSMLTSNVGNQPNTSVFWSTTRPGTTRYRGTFSGYVGGIAASQSAAGYSAYSMYPYKTCQTKAQPAMTFVTYSGTSGGVIYGNQFTDPSPSNCTEAPINQGVVGLGSIATL